MSLSVPAGDRQQHPDGAGDRGGPAEPDPGRVADHGQRGGGDEQQVAEQAGQRRVLGLHQCRRDEGADEPDRGDQLAVPQRDRHPDQRGRGQQHEARQRRHQFVEHAGAVRGPEQHGDPAGRQSGRCLVGDVGPQDLAPASHSAATIKAAPSSAASTHRMAGPSSPSSTA